MRRWSPGEGRGKGQVTVPQLSSCAFPPGTCVTLPAAGTYPELHCPIEMHPQHLLDGRDDVLLYGSSGQHCKRKPAPNAVSGIVNNTVITLPDPSAEPVLCQSDLAATKTIFQNGKAQSNSSGSWTTKSPCSASAQCAKTLDSVPRQVGPRIRDCGLTLYWLRVVGAFPRASHGWPESALTFSVKSHKKNSFRGQRITQILSLWYRIIKNKNDTQGQVSMKILNEVMLPLGQNYPWEQRWYSSPLKNTD